MATSLVPIDLGRTVPGVLVALLLLPGCESPDPTTVHGTVTLDGAPVPEGRIVFSSPLAGTHVVARLGAEGEYAVRTANGPGLPPGGYRVWLSPPPVDAPMGPGFAPPKPSEPAGIPKKYRHADTSGLYVMVEDGDNQFDVHMRPQEASPSEKADKTAKIGKTENSGKADKSEKTGKADGREPKAAGQG